MPDYEANLASLQRLGLPDARTNSLTFDASNSDFPVGWRLQRIRAIGQYPSQEGVGSDSQRRSAGLPSERLMGALSGREIPFVLRVSSRSDSEIDFSVGTWTTSPEQSVDMRWDILDTACRVSYSAFNTTEPANLVPGPGWLAGYVLGTPAPDFDQTADGTLPLDRLVSAMGGGDWAFMVMAMPASQRTVSKLRGLLLAELADVATFVHNQNVPDPGAEHFLELGKKTLESITSGISAGMWRVGVYLLGEPVDYFRLAGAWRGTFSGERSVPDSVRVVDDQRALALAKQRGLPNLADASQQGRFRHPLAFQTLMTSGQLAAYCSLPRKEIPGLRVRKVFRLDMEPPEVKRDAHAFGTVVVDPHETDRAGHAKPYLLGPELVKEHVFVAGVTGTGKTNTVFAILKCACAWHVPFLVIEPAKAEYRKLKVADWAQDMEPQFYTLGDENERPLRLNPFEVLGGARKDVGKHIDLLRSVFTASFGLWSPLPEILERCIHEVYEDCGWDPISNTNHRIDDQASVPATAYPTLSDLVSKVEKVIASLQYDKEASDRMRAALVTRLDSLRSGAKGEMLDCQVLTDEAGFCTGATVLELEHMGSDDDKAFVMGLIMIRLAEQLIAEGQSKELKLILVVEEAHRLLGQTGPKASAEQGDPKAKAVESFSNLLAEIRAYGMSIVIADQSPNSLAPSVMRNTNLKIAHRLLATDERHAMGGAMALSDKESEFFATIPNHFAAVFAKGDDRPLMVHVDPAKPEEEPKIERQDTRGRYRLKKSVSKLCQEREMRRRFAVLMLALCEPGWHINAPLREYKAGIAARCPSDVDALAFRTLADQQLCAVVLRERGETLGWQYIGVEQLRQDLDSLLEEIASPSRNANAVTARRAVFMASYSALSVRKFDPYPLCSRVCGKLVDGSGPCRYRAVVGDALRVEPSEAARKLAAVLENLPQVKKEDGETRFDYSVIAQHCLKATEPVVGPNPDNDDASRLALSMCYAQQAMQDMAEYRVTHFVANVLTQLHTEAQEPS